ncbi:MAG TPA: hypothetical protein VHE37_14605, partial [Nevskiaceae bacterium]|nr:hypothetical protein [Nevskiaceae bacterium]
ALESFPFPHCVENCGRLEHDPATGLSGRERVLRLMDTADALLLLHGNDGFCEEYFPSKLYEYLWTQRPILALVHHNPDLENFLRELGHEPAPAEDAQAIGEVLTRLMQRWDNDDLRDNGRVSPYSTQRSVEQLVNWGREISAPARR